MSKYLKITNNSGKTTSPALRKLQRNIYRQAGLAVLTIVLTIVIIFAMASAWYTNIVQTSGLVFQAEAWGFDGEVVIDETPIVAGPGDSGLIPVQAENNTDSISAISFKISKSAMEPEMQKRLYFYVDTQATKNGETVDRVYLNESDSYTYTVFNQSWLTLTEERHNNALLKWEWVYDVLGYYVLAQHYEVDVPATDTEPASKQDVMLIEDYLRPIEYDYDAATTTLVSDEDGNLSMELSKIDGVTDPDFYVYQLSFRDGYPGEIDLSKKMENGFYPVEVDSNGYGVYAYLCNYTEIENATIYDTELGALAYKASKNADLTDDEIEKLTYRVELIIAAQKNENTVAVVSTLAELEDAMANKRGDVIQLDKDITIPENQSLTIPKNTRMMVDLNGHTVESVSAGPAIKTEPGSVLTLTNGTIKGKDLASSRGIHAVGSEVIMSNVKILGFDYGTYVSDSDSNNLLDSRLHMLNCEVNAKTSGVYVNGNGTNSAQKTQIVIEQSKITGESYGIASNGTSTGTGKWGTDIQVISSTITSSPTVVGAAIYHPQMDSNLVTYKSTLSGYTGMVIKGGHVSVIDTTVSGTGGTHATPAFSNSGFSDTADAVYIETNYGYEIVLEISGTSNFSSIATGSQSLRVYEDTATNVAIQIAGGTFKEKQPTNYIAEGSVQNETNGSYVVN